MANWPYTAVILATVMEAVNIFILIISTVFLLPLSSAIYQHDEENSSDQRMMNTGLESNANTNKKESQPTPNPSNEAGFFLPYKKLPDFQGKYINELYSKSK